MRYPRVERAPVEVVEVYACVCGVPSCRTRHLLAVGTINSGMIGESEWSDAVVQTFLVFTLPFLYSSASLLAPYIGFI